VGGGGLVRARGGRAEASGADTASDREAELNALRESFHAELARKAARIAELEQLVEETARNYRTTLSWRVTAPLRAARRVTRAMRRS
jgi:pantothenate kinase-related protein Tda10